MDNFTKNGRKLRPRKTVAADSRSTDEHRTYGEHRPAAERRTFGERKTYGEHKTYGERRPYGEHRSSAERRPYGEHRPDTEHRPYGEHRTYGEHKTYGERRSFGERKSYGEHNSYGEHRGPRKPSSFRKPYSNRTEPRFSKESEEGINRMISRRPSLDQKETSGKAVEFKFQEEVRLNRFIANSGICSRREADTYILAGVVTVNGEVVTELGTKVNVLTDDVRFNGQRLKGEEKVYLVMNKPRGYVTTASDPHAEKTVMDLLEGCTARVFPVGRLDKNTTGVLMFTNDGEISERLTHPSFNKKKIYQVILDRPLSADDYNKVLEGVTLSDGLVCADELEFIDEQDHRKLGIEIHSGKNRIVRRIFESLGYDVKALDRVYFAGLTKKGLKKGEWRFLSESEVNILKMGSYV